MQTNKGFPLITSLAPKLSRLGSGGEEIGSVYQKYCIDSWLRSGFVVYSLNTAAEIEQLKHAYLDVHFIEAPRDGAALVGRPLVFISDMVTALRDRGYEQCGIINSDIYMTPTPSLVDFLMDEIPGSCVFGHRIDVKTLGEHSGSEYTQGYDFFFFETNDFDDAFSPFMQGVPWWDYGLPLMLGIKGRKMKRLSSSVFFHLFHEQKWDSRSWRKYYMEMRKMITGIALKSIVGDFAHTAANARGVSFLMGEGMFASEFIPPPSNLIDDDIAFDAMLRSYAYYCLEALLYMSEVVVLPSEENTILARKKVADPMLADFGPSLVQEMA